MLQFQLSMAVESRESYTVVPISCLIESRSISVLQIYSTSEDAEGPQFLVAWRYQEHPHPSC